MGLILPLENPVQAYAWGSPTAIPEFLGVLNPNAEPRAELWIGAHHKGPSMVVEGAHRIPLSQRIDEDPVHWLGARVAGTYHNRLPFLLKVIAAAEPLSIQCHPSLARAQAGFLRENAAGLSLTDPARNYRDDNHKPELLCALSTFTALKGFKPLDEIESDLGDLDLVALRDDFEAFVASRDLAALYTKVMTRPDEQRRALAEQAAQRAAQLVGPSFEWIVRLAERYPGDIGVLSPAFLNLVELQRDQAIYLGDGELHAYLGGVGVEVMASSDNVIRGGLTQKHVDVPELLNTVRFDAKPAEILTPQRRAPGARLFDTPAPDFALTVVDLSNETPHFAEERDAVEFILAADGNATIVPTEPQGAPVRITKGRAVLVSGAVRAYEITGSARLYKAGVPPVAG